MKKMLLGHVSPETAFMQDDYPYSFTLRCRRRVWIETKKNFGQRVVTQTENPKTGRWNAPKPGTYNLIEVMYFNEENGHVEFAAIIGYTSADKIREFQAEYAEALQDQRSQDYLKVLLLRASK